MNNILINASAAKTGGAETIIRAFVSRIPNDDNQYIVVSPLNFDTTGRNNIVVINKKTNGINTILFTLIGIFIFVIKFKPIKIISFNNINYIFSSDKGITYFHQLKALDKDYSDTKIKIYNFCIRFLLRKNTFIVQSALVKQLFIDRFKYKKKQVVSCWPGFNIPMKKNHDIQDLKEDFTFVGVLPIAYESSHKNVDSLKELLPELQKNKIRIITLLNDEKSSLPKTNNIVNIGSVERDVLFDIYAKCDFMIFTSKAETVGLPIFEFMQTGKPAFVYDADYSQSYYKHFHKPRNFIIYNGSRDFMDKFRDNINSFDNSKDYSLGEWDKLFKLIDNQRDNFLKSN